MAIEARTRSAAAGRALCSLALSLSALACSGRTPAAAAATASPEASGLARYLPLEHDTVYSYETSTTPPTEPGVLILEVRRPRPETAELVVAGRVRRLRVSSDAVAHAAGGFLLREPLRAGAGFHGDFGHVRITRTDAQVHVPAGTFGGCVETVEELVTREGEKRTTTTFCPGIGIALRETEAEQGAERQSERIALKSFGKKFVAP